ncbi:MAG: hypothetical protein ACFNZX_07780, partial [Actinomyces sp.]
RGAMTSFILRNRLSSPADLLGFEYEGFTYQANYGDAEHHEQHERDVHASAGPRVRCDVAR